MKTTHRRKAAYGSLALVALLLLAACSGGTTDGRATGSQRTTAGESTEETTGVFDTAPMTPPDTVSYSDLVFVDEMALRLRWELEMAGVAENSARSQRLVGLAREMVPAREEGIVRLRSIKKQAYGLQNLPADVSPEEYAALGLTDPASLAGAKPFDKAFVDALLPGLAGTAELADRAAGRSEDPDVRSFARATAEEREREISVFSGYRESRYPRSR